MADEIREQLALKRYNLLDTVSLDDQGHLYFNISDTSLLKLAQLQTTNSRDDYDDDTFDSLPKKSAVIMPFAEILNEYDVNQLRGL